MDSVHTLVEHTQRPPENTRRMSLVDLGKRLLEAAKRGETDTVRALMSNGAPFTTDWVRCYVHLVLGKADCILFAFDFLDFILHFKCVPNSSHVYEESICIRA